MSLYGSHTFAINSDFVEQTTHNLGFDWVTEVLIKICDSYSKLLHLQHLTTILINVYSCHWPATCSFFFGVGHLCLAHFHHFYEYKQNDLSGNYIYRFFFNVCLALFFLCEIAVIWVHYDLKAAKTPAAKMRHYNLKIRWESNTFTCCSYVETREGANNEQTTTFHISHSMSCWWT